MTRNGARIIAVPSADWPAIATKHHSHLVFRAIENRVTMIKADTAYGSALIDPYGRIIASSISTIPRQEVLTACVPLGPASSPAVRLGDWVGWLTLAGLTCMAVLDFVWTAWSRARTSGPSCARNSRG